MPGTAQKPTTPPSAGATNFAGILASVADPPWNDDGLASDITTISYEQALRAHSRTPRKDADPDPPPSASPQPAASGKRLKNASITIRLSESECALVRQRAAEAGLTISAYLRSCALEAESLRAQVKETLAQLRSTPTPAHDRGRGEQAHRSTLLSRTWERIRHWETNERDK